MYFALISLTRKYYPIYNIREFSSVCMYVCEIFPFSFGAKVSFICVSSMHFLKNLCTAAPLGCRIHTCLHQSPLIG